MSCPSIEDLFAGHAEEHAAGCAACKIILGMAATTPGSQDSCEIVEALIAARVSGSLALESEVVLFRHLESCPACMRVASEIQAPGLAEAFHDMAVEADDFEELFVIASENYVRGEEIGRGGMGRVVHARDRRLGRPVAIKELLDDRMRSRFEREARLTARLQHPAIVSILEAGRWPSGEPFYAMKYVAGKPLHAVIAERPSLLGRLALLPSFVTVVEAIAYSHSEGVIHRDLKPQNILIGAFGETVVVDWGLAKELARPEPHDSDSPPYRSEQVDLTAAGAGTPAYMAPEQARGEEPDEGVDIYALGATLHHLLGGSPPEGAPLPAEVPDELRAVVRKAMAPARDNRYLTAAELVEELRRFQTGQLVTAHRYSLPALAARWLRRNRTRLLAVAACAAAVGLFFVARRTVTPAPTCEGGADHLLGVWDPAVRSAVAKAFLASGRPYATDTFARVEAAFDRYAAGWSAMRKEACEATTVRHEQSEALLDQRMQCLDRRLGEMRALTTLLGSAPDGKLVDRAVVAVAKLDDIESCADADALAATVPLPQGPSIRAEITSLRALLQRAHALYLVGKYRAALEMASPILVEADRIAFAPLQLEAIFEVEFAQTALGDWKGVEPNTRRRLALAARLGNDRKVAGAWLTLILELDSSGRPEQALGLGEVAEVAIARAGDPPDLRAKLLVFS